MGAAGGGGCWSAGHLATSKLAPFPSPKTLLCQAAWDALGEHGLLSDEQIKAIVAALMAAVKLWIEDVVAGRRAIHACFLAWHRCPDGVPVFALAELLPEFYKELVAGGAVMAGGDAAQSVAVGDALRSRGAAASNPGGLALMQRALGFRSNEFYGQWLWVFW